MVILLSFHYIYMMEMANTKLFFCFIKRANQEFTSEKMLRKLLQDPTLLVISTHHLDITERGSYQVKSCSAGIKYGEDSFLLEYLVRYHVELMFSSCHVCRRVFSILVIHIKRLFDMIS